MRTTRLASAVLVSALAVGGLTLAAGQAQADPPSGTFRQLVGVGSDTTQDVLNALAGDTVNGTGYAGTALTADGARVASYDAIEPGTGSTSSSITTRSGGPSFPRPNGSGNGRIALSQSLTGDKTPVTGNVAIKGQIDFARSSGGPSTSGTTLTYIPLARDAVGVAAKGGALHHLTVDQLHDIYAGSLLTVDGQSVHPFIPQAGSGTRKFFLAAIGLTDGTLGTNVAVVQENQANPALTTDGSLVPFSVGSWIAQNNGVSPDFSSAAVAGGAYLADIQLPGDTGTTSPVVTVNGKLAPVAGYYENATFGRDVYDVVPSRAIDPTSVFFDKALYDIFVTNGTHVAQTASDAAESVIAKFGFLNEPYNGSVNPSKHAKFGGLEEGTTISTALPGKPVLKSAPSSGGVKLSWTAPANTGLPVTDYRVVLTASNGTVVANKDVLATTTSATFANLAVGSYTATVQAANLNGSGPAATWSGAVKFASTVTAKAAATAYGKAPHVSVFVRDTHALTATGKVTVTEGTATRGTATLDSHGNASVPVSSKLSVGTHTFTVTYAGNAKLASSKVTVKLTVTKATPALSVSAPKTVSHLSRGKATVKVTAPGTTPAGTVRIYSGKSVIATGKLSGGKVVVTLPKLSKGNHTLRAYFAGSTTVAARYGANFTVKSS